MAEQNTVRRLIREGLRFRQPVWIIETVVTRKAAQREKQGSEAGLEGLEGVLGLVVKQLMRDGGRGTECRHN